MKRLKLYSILIATTTIFYLPKFSLAQLTNFYSSPNYSNFINTLISNSIWKSSMEKYTKDYKASPGNSNRASSDDSLYNVVPEYRRYRAVQFQPTGTRLTVQEYLDAAQISPQEKEELKKLILDIFKKYEASAAKKGYPNDWALAYVSFVGLNSHVYNSRTEELMIPFEQNIGLRDAVAEQATDNGLFNGVTDQEKQKQYELLIILGGLTYHYYEKALKEKNIEDLQVCKLSAAQNLRLVGIKPQ